MWSLSAQPDACFHPTKEERKLAASDEPGGVGRIPQTHGFGSCCRNIPQVPFSGLASHKKLAHYNHPDVLPWLRTLLWETQGVRCPRAQEPQQPHVGCQKLLAEIGVWLLATQKSLREQVGEGCSMLDTGNLGGEGVGQMPVQREPHPPPIDNQWEGAFIGRGKGVTCRNSTVSS